jgi:pimeloyl-ACP methyl ester carboxylesterase
VPGASVARPYHEPREEPVAAQRTSGASARTITLSDGRTVAYCEFGDRAGRPVLSCHGGLVGRLDVAAADVATATAGIRLISPDRPGIGASTRAEGRNVAGWVADASELCDALGIGSFAVVAWSMGAPYALACAATLDRVTSAVVVAGGVPLDWPSVGGAFPNRKDAALMKMVTERPDAARTLLAASRGLIENSPLVWWEGAKREMTDTDVAAVERFGIEAYARAVAGGLADVDGALDEYVAYAAPWGFAYEDVAVPVALWQGTDDEMVPVGWSEEAARRLQRATLRLVSGFGHFVAWDHWDAVLADLR